MNAFSRIILLSLTGLILAGCAAKSPTAPTASAPAEEIRAEERIAATPEAVLATARSQIGAPYRSGGVAPETGYDCSGLVWWVYSRNGLNLPRETDSQLRSGIPVPPEAARPGDLLFYDITGKRKNLHVGIYNGQGGFVHSPRPGATVREESIDKEYWQSRFLEVRRVIE